jgi:hypothetical protein
LQPRVDRSQPVRSSRQDVRLRKAEGSRQSCNQESQQGTSC